MSTPKTLSFDQAAAPENWPADEMARLFELWQLGVLDSEAEQRFDDITSIVVAALDVPTALVSLVDIDRQWFKSRQGMPVEETPRCVAFCAHALKEPETLIIPDATKDPRFKDNALVTEAPHIRAYAGAVLRTPNRFPIGSLCAIDYKPREFTEREIGILKALARIVERELVPDSGEVQQRSKANLNAFVDPLTGLSLEETFLTRLSQKFNDSKDAKCVNMVLEIGDIQTSRSAFGQSAVHRMMLELADRLTSVSMERKISVGRLAHNQFCLGWRDDGNANATIDAIVETLSAPYAIEGLPHNPPIGFGAVTVDAIVDGPSVGLKLAKEAMAIARDADSRGISVHVVAEKDLDGLRLHHRAADSLIDALSENEITANFVAETDPKSGAVAAIHVSPHWYSLAFDGMTGDEIMAAARAADCVPSLTLRMVNDACRAAVGWREAGLAVPRLVFRIDWEQANNEKLLNAIGKIVEIQELEPSLLKFVVEGRLSMHQGRFEFGLASDHPVPSGEPVPAEQFSTSLK